MRDAFELGDAWGIHSDAPRPQRLMADNFRQAHRLTGVLQSAGRAYAMIDGRIVTIGQTIDGFKLTEVAHRSATFESNTEKVVLSLSEREGTGGVAGASP
jgi:hypothetical protein